MQGRRALLFVAPLMPAEGGNGLAMRAAMFLEGLARDFDVTLLVIPVAGGSAAVSPFVRRRTRRVEVLALDGTTDALWDLSARIRDPAERAAALAAYPRPALCRHASAPCLEAVRTAIGGSRFDVVHVMRSYLAPYAAPFLVDGSDAPIAFASVDLDDDEARTHRRLSDLYAQHGQHDDARIAAAEADKYERHEAEWLPRFRLRIGCTREHALAATTTHLGGIPAVVPNTVALPWRMPALLGRRRERSGGNVLFVGNLSYFPNVEGIRHFALETMQALRSRSGRDISLRIAGSAPAPEVVALAAHPGVELVVDPPRLAGHYRWADVCVVPIAVGGGTRIKLLEAFAHEVPVVSTRLGAEGIAAENGEHLLLAERDDGFVDACLAVLSDRALAARLARNARRLVESRYSREAGVEMIRAAFAPALQP